MTKHRFTNEIELYHRIQGLNPQSFPRIPPRVARPATLALLRRMRQAAA
jgi:hypothetical protein